jgi:uncharacterized protein
MKSLLDKGDTLLQAPKTFLSQGIVDKDGQGHLLAFNPVFFGGPVLISEDQKKILELAKGKTIHEVGNLLKDFPDFDKNLEFLLERGILVTENSLQKPDFDSIPKEKRKLKVYVVLTDECNRRDRDNQLGLSPCAHCYAEGGSSTMHPELAKHVFEKIVRISRQEGFGRVNPVFFGGEPTKKFESIIKPIFEHMGKVFGQEEIQSGRIQFGISTNGLLIDKEMAKFFVENGTGVGFSVSDIMNDDKRKKNPRSAETFLDNISYYRDLCAEKNLGRSTVMITVTEETLPYLPSIMVEFLKRGIFVRFSLLKSSYVNAIMDKDRQEKYSREAIKQLGECFKILKTVLLSMPPQKAPPEPHPTGLQYLFESMLFQKPKQKVCGVGTGLFLVNQSGMVCSCNLALDKSLGPLDDNVMDLIGKQQSLIADCCNLSGCSECEWRFNCAGGCQLTTLRLTGKAGPSPWCDVYKAIMPLWLELEGYYLLTKQ